MPWRARSARSGSVAVNGTAWSSGLKATPFQPRQPVESFIETGAPGNTFVEFKIPNPPHPVNADAPPQAVTLRAFNDSDRKQEVQGTLALTDFFDKQIVATQLTLSLPPHSPGSLAPNQFFPREYGFFRAMWTPEPSPEASLAGTNSAPAHILRCAALRTVNGLRHDPLFGCNHAYPWDFLVRMAHQAGVGWWRDWSAQWQLVEPEPGRFDFTLPDEQIRRVQALDGHVRPHQRIGCGRGAFRIRRDTAQDAGRGGCV